MIMYMTILPFAFHDIDYVNEVSAIRQNPKKFMQSTDIEIRFNRTNLFRFHWHLYQYSVLAGQMDFMCGAIRSKGGKPSLHGIQNTHKGDNVLFPFLNKEPSCYNTYAHVHYVVTEYGGHFTWEKSPSTCTGID